MTTSPRASKNSIEIHLAEYLKQSAEGILRIDPAPLQAILDRLFRYRIDRSGTVWVIGNGGSQANASHLVLHLQEHGIAAHDLLAESAALTAISNDHDYAKVGSRMLRSMAIPDDMLVVISGSGDSPNIIMALAEAKRMGLYRVGLLGFAGGMALSLCNDHVLIASTNFGQLEDAHSALIHAINNEL